MAASSKDATCYAERVEFDVRIVHLIENTQKYINTSSLRIPGRILNITTTVGEEVRGVLKDGENKISFRGEPLIFESFESYDLVVMEGLLRRENLDLIFIVNQIQTVTPCARKINLTMDLKALSIEEKRNHPEIDLIHDTDRGQILRLRPQLFRETRRYLEREGFLEVDTPFIVPWPDVAPVAPVVVSKGCHVSRGDLRIANTEFMRRLLVGGFDRIYQLGRCFRDEKPDWKHEVEFTQLTFGAAYVTYDYLMKFIEGLILHLHSILEKSFGNNLQGNCISFQRPWKKITVRNAILEFCGIDIYSCDDWKDLMAVIQDTGLSLPEFNANYGGLLTKAQLLDLLIETYVIPKLEGPTWIHEYPFYLGGPAKEFYDKPMVKMRAELFIKGIEIANISVPQNNPVKVREWYEEMRRLKCDQGWETPYLDEPYLESMDIGIPIATTGGLGFDRLLMVLLNVRHIRDVLFFPSGSQYVF